MTGVSDQRSIVTSHGYIKCPRIYTIYTIYTSMGVKPNGKLLETNMAVKACDPPLLHGAFQRSRCPSTPLPE